MPTVEEVVAVSRSAASRWSYDRADLAQDAAVAIISSADRYDPALGPWVPWAKRVASNAILDQMRARRAAKRGVEVAVDPVVLDASVGTPGNQLEVLVAKERRSHVNLARIRELAGAEWEELLAWSEWGDKGAVERMGLLTGNQKRDAVIRVKFHRKIRRVLDRIRDGMEGRERV